MNTSVIPYPVIKQINDYHYQLVRTYIVLLPNKKTLQILPGFVTDGASVPKLFWNIIGSPFTGNYTRAGIIHDALYASKILPRKQCDSIFFKIIKECGGSWLERTLMWAGVRIFGGFAWKKHTSSSVIENRKLISFVNQ